MKEIFDFTAATPPPLSETMLKDALRRRRLRRQTALLAFAAALSQLSLLLAAVLVAPLRPALAAVCVAGVCLTMIADGIIALVFSKKWRVLP